MAQKSNGIAVTLFKCVRCVHFICCAVVFRRCRKKRKADDVQTADDDASVVDVEGGLGSPSLEVSNYNEGGASASAGPGAVGNASVLATPSPATLYHHEGTSSSSAPSSTTATLIAPAAAISSTATNVVATETLSPSQLAAAAKAAVPPHMAAHSHPASHAVVASAPIKGGDIPTYSDEDEEEEESDDSGEGGVPNLLTSSTPMFQAPAISLTKSTPRVIDESTSGIGRSMASLKFGADALKERRHRRQELLQQLQVRRDVWDASRPRPRNG